MYLYTQYILWALQNQVVDVLCLQGGDSLFRRWTFKQTKSYKPYLSRSFYTETEQSCIAIIIDQPIEVRD